MRVIFFTSLLMLLSNSFCWSNETTALDSLLQVLGTYEQQNDFSNKAQTLLGIGKTYQVSNQHEEAIEYLKKAEEVSKQNGYEEVLKESLKSIATVYLSTGNYEDAYYYQLQRLQFSQELKDSINIAKSYYDIGSIYFYQEDLEKALQHYQKSKDIAESLNDSTVLYLTYAALGSVYGEKKDRILSLSYNSRSLEIAEAIEYKMGIAYSARNVGQNYFSEKKYEKALQNFKRSLEIMHELGNSTGEAINLWSIGNVYSKLNQHDSALSYLENALKLTQKIGDKSHVREIYEDIAEANFFAGKLAEAYQYQKKYVVLKDSLVNEERIKQMADLQHQNELQQTELEILKKEQQLQNLLKIFLGIVVFFLLLISILLYSRYRLQTQSNELLAKANEAIQSQNKKLEATNNDLEKFAYIASHDLKEPLRMIGGYITLIERRYGDRFNENAKYFMGFIHEAIQRMYQLLDDLLIYSKLNIRENSYKKIDVQEIVSKVLQNLQSQIEENEITIQTNNLPNQLVANEDELSLVFHNLISNAIKFRSKQPPNINISCQPNGSAYIFSIEDNGIGISAEYLEKVFVPFQRLHTRDNYEGNGIGLAICKKVVEQHNGKIWVESAEEKGSTFYFTLPYSMW